jgi:hypothetical protein
LDQCEAFDLIGFSLSEEKDIFLGAVLSVYLPRLPAEMKIFRVNSTQDLLEVWLSHEWEILKSSHR